MLENLQACFQNAEWIMMFYFVQVLLIFLFQLTKSQNYLHSQCVSSLEGYQRLMLYYSENFSFIAEETCCKSYKIVARILQVNFNKIFRGCIPYDILSIGRVILEQTQNLVSFWTFTGPLVQNLETLENFFSWAALHSGPIKVNLEFSFSFAVF